MCYEKKYSVTCLSPAVNLSALVQTNAFQIQTVNTRTQKHHESCSNCEYAYTPQAGREIRPEHTLSDRQGTIVGFVTALAFCMWMSFGAFSTGNRPEPLPTSVAGCSSNMTSLGLSVTSTTAVPVQTTSSAVEMVNEEPG